MAQPAGPRRRGRRGAGLAAAVVVLCTLVARGAEPTAATATLPGVVVVGERQVTGTPASIDRVRRATILAPAQRSVSEWLDQLPGVGARDRQNFAQDVQLTIRGFGARSAFGVRGLQIIVDGIPATMPDGQGQVSHVALQALARVDVLRGPFSALYGNASGGVIEFASADPPATPVAGGRISAGSDAAHEGDAWIAGPWQAASTGGYRIDFGHSDLGGFRRHSGARRAIGQARLVTTTSRDTRIALTANTLDLRADDPQGLTLDQARLSPRDASAGALAFDTRKRVRQAQAGLRVEQSFGAHSIVTLGTWAGTRTTFQMLSVPVAAQAAPGSGGGVVDLDRHYSGADLRWRGDAMLAGRPASLTIGAETQQSSEHRLGHENFIGEQLGVVGALRRDQRDRVANDDVFAEARWAFAPRWTGTVGVRRSRVAFASRDAYVTSGNPDDSGTLHYRQVTPVAGVLFQPTPSLEAYANAGRGFETPSSSELAYRADGRSGLNDALRPARSRNAEAGLRWHRGDRALSLAAFASRTRDELVVASNSGGRSTYSNAATSDRRGWELAASGPVSSRWRYALAYSRLDARYRDGFATCRAPPCLQPDTQVAAGNRIPATSPRSAWGQLRWAARADTDWFVEGQALGRVYADDANTAHAPGHATLDIGVERRWRIGRWRLEGFARIDNVADRHVIGSVIVNDGNGRYFEPAPGRTWLLGVSIHDQPPDS